MSSNWIEVTVLHVYPADVAGVPTTVLVGPCERSNASVLRIPVNGAEAILVNAMFRRQQTAKAPAFSLVRRMATALGARVRAVYLVADGTTPIDGAAPMRGYLEVWRRHRRLEVPISAGLALGAASGLGIPLVADRKHFVASSTDPEAPVRIPRTADIPRDL